MFEAMKDIPEDVEDENIDIYPSVLISSSFPRDLLFC
jgi:hypothetical protein